MASVAFTDVLDQLPSYVQETVMGILRSNGIDTAALQAAKDGPHSKRLSVRQAQEYLGIGRTTLHEEVKAGRIPVIRIGRRLLFDSRDVDVYLAACKTKKNRKDRRN